jgi:hypothetical protein
MSKPILTEDVQMVQRLKGTYQIVDWGHIGRFKVYSAAKPTPDNERLRRELGLRHPDLHKIYKLAEYKRDMRDNRMFLDFAVKQERDVRTTLLQASRKLAWMGFKPMDVTLIFRNLEHIQNQITGGGIGGRYVRSKHGTEINLVDFLQGRPDWREEIVIHEYAHAYWGTILPKHAKKAFADFYWDQIVSKVEGGMTSDAAIEQALEGGWRIVQDRVRAEMGGLDIEGYMKLYDQYAETLRKAAEKDDRETYEQLQKQVRADVTDTAMRSTGLMVYTATVKEPFGEYEAGDRVRVIRSGKADKQNISVIPE